MGRIVLFIALLVYLIVGLRGMEHAVLCFGSDGHVAVEASQNGRCINFSASSSHRDPQTSSGNTISSAGSHCVGCTDIPLSINNNIKKVIFVKKYVPQKEITSLVGFSYISPLSELFLADKIFLKHPPFMNLALNTLRTVIYLI